MKNIVDLIAERNYYDAGLLIAQVYAPCCADCGNKLTPTDIGQGLMRARHHCSSAVEWQMKLLMVISTATLANNNLLAANVPPIF